MLNWKKVGEASHNVEFRRAVTEEPSGIYY